MNDDERQGGYLRSLANRLLHWRRRHQLVVYGLADLEKQIQDRQAASKSGQPLAFLVLPDGICKYFATHGLETGDCYTEEDPVRFAILSDIDGMAWPDLYAFLVHEYGVPLDYDQVSDRITMGQLLSLLASATDIKI